MVRHPHKVHGSHGSIKCDNGVFGDPTPGAPKQCFCETGLPIARKVQKCSDEGDDCMCKGNIFYGAGVVDDKPSDFESMLTLPFKFRLSPDEDIAIKCDNAHFGDPLPGTQTPKACFCDDIGRVSINQITSRQEMAIAAQNTLRANEASAKLEEETKAKEAEIAKIRAKHMEEMEKQAKKNKDALEAMMAADKEQAEKQKAASMALEAAEKDKQKELDKKMHEQEKLDLAAKKEAEKQALEYAVAMKAAHDASELDRFKMQLEAEKKRAEMHKMKAAADLAAANFAKAQEL